MAYTGPSIKSQCNQTWARILGYYTTQGSNRAFELLAKRFEGFVGRLIVAYLPGRWGATHEDIRQMAYMGLLNACRDADYTRNTFTSYAFNNMRGYVANFKRDKGHLVHFPREYLRTYARVVNAKYGLASQLGREPTTREIYDAIPDKTTEHLDYIYGVGNFKNLYSLDTILDAAAEMPVTLAELIPDPSDDYEDVEESDYIKTVLKVLSKNLSKRQTKVMYKRFFQHKSQRIIGDELGISQMEVSREMRRSLAIIREQLGVHLVEVPRVRRADAGESSLATTTPTP